jgi:hypothetical protein
MTSPVLAQLVDRIRSEEILDEVTADGAVVHGVARFEAAGADVTVNVDPELDGTDDVDVDVDALVVSLHRVLGASEATWSTMLAAIADDLEDMVDEGPAAADKDLRQELEARSLVVLADATLLRLEAVRSFPGARIVVQIDDDYEVQLVEVQQIEEIETRSFDRVDDLLDHVNDER